MIDYNTAAANYAKNRQIQPEVFKHLCTTSRIKIESRVLEVGCGTGNYITALKSTVGCQGWGLDPSAGMLATAKEKSVDIDFQLGSAESLEFQNDFFDLLFSVDVIHHVRDRPAYFQAAYRILKTDGHLCTVTDSETIIRRR